MKPALNIRNIHIKTNGWRKIYNPNTNQKKVGVAILILELASKQAKLSEI